VLSRARRACECAAAGATCRPSAVRSDDPAIAVIEKHRHAQSGFPTE
jgi:hypothetical protein